MRILLAEDEVILAKSLKEGLTEEKFAVDMFHDGLEAYEQAAANEYDILILDIMMPGMDGLTICSKLRQEKNYTPILMLTARDTVEDRVKGLDNGADDYLIKPFSFDELLARIRSVIRRATSKDTILKVANLELNPKSHIVRRGGKEINLTGKEYALLEYFMRHPNQILTRENILDHVWDYSFDSFSNIIEVLMRRLRNKIDKSFPNDKPLFSTIRGMGYKING